MNSNKGVLRNLSMAVMAVIFLVVLLPIPVLLLDILITLNILLSLYLLINTAMAKKLEDYSRLPTMLLGMTLLNLATLIAATRVILTKGQEFDGLLIGFIASLEKSLSRGFSGVVIDLSIFICIFSISIVVITKGSTRVAEVAARFTLDTAQVKLMAIEAELEAKTITQEEANERKNAVNSESDFYGSLGGVSKFISGNARLLIIVFIVTIAAGIFIGTKFRQEELNDSIITYVSLAIGSGIFVIIPSYILSTAVGVAVTKFVLNSNSDAPSGTYTITKTN